MFFIFFPTNLAQKFKKSIFFFLFSYISLATKPIKSVRFTKQRHAHNFSKHKNIQQLLYHSFTFPLQTQRPSRIQNTFNKPKSLHALIQIYRPKQTQIAKTLNSRLLSSSSPTPTSTSPLSGSSFSKIPLPKTSTMCMSTLILLSTSPALRAPSSNSASFWQKKPIAARWRSSLPHVVCLPPPSLTIRPTHSSSSFFYIRSPWSSDPGWWSQICLWEPFGFVKVLEIWICLEQVKESETVFEERKEVRVWVFIEAG